MSDSDFQFLIYFNRNRRFTKSKLGPLTSPFLFMRRLRFFDFFVRMWRLKAFWNVIFPVPVTLNLFLALEFVFTLGILNMLYDYTLLALRTGRDLWSRLGNVASILDGSNFP